MQEPVQAKYLSQLNGNSSKYLEMCGKFSSYEVIQINVIQEGVYIFDSYSSMSVNRKFYSRVFNPYNIPSFAGIPIKDMCNDGRKMVTACT